MGGPVTPLPLFCLYSLAFGVVLCVLRTVMGAVLSFVCLLPTAKETPRPRYAVGYFLWDVLFFTMSAILYLVFLFATAGGVFRLYSLLLVLLGFLLFYPLGKFIFLRLSRLFLFLRRLAFRLVSLPLVPVLRLFRRIFQKKKAKT